MFIILLKPGQNRVHAASFMEGHKSWLEQGMEEGTFLLWGSMKQGGGAILAAAGDLDALKARLDMDPFVAEQIVSVEIIELAPARAVEQLSFLLA